jgi:hypothetical protein
VDSWLHAQRGWRRLAVMFLSLLPMSAGYCVTWKGLDLSGVATLTPGQVGQALALSVPVAAVPICLLLAGAARANRRRPGTPQGRLAPITWRMVAGFTLMAWDTAVSSLISEERHHWEAFPLQVILLAGAAAMLFWNARYVGRGSDRAVPSDQVLPGARPWWCVAVQDAGAVGAAGFGCSVGVQR